jgi:hypothetical protein
MTQWAGKKVRVILLEPVEFEKEVNALMAWRGW